MGVVYNNPSIVSELNTHLIHIQDQFVKIKFHEKTFRLNSQNINPTKITRYMVATVLLYSLILTNKNN